MTAIAGYRRTICFVAQLILIRADEGNLEEQSFARLVHAIGIRDR